MDILFHLRIKTGHPIFSYWERADDNLSYKPTQLGYKNLSHHLSSFEEGKCYRFEDNLEVLCEHRFDLIQLHNPSTPVVLFVRDPIDAIFSWYRRCCIEKHGLSFQQYLRRICFFNEHLPYQQLQVTPQHVYNLFILYWMSAVDNILLVRFEDIKSDPVLWVEKVLRHIDIERSSEEIAQASVSCSFENLSQSQQGIYWSESNKASTRYEWRNRMSDADYERLHSDTISKFVSTKLGYLSSDSVVDVFHHSSDSYDFLAHACQSMIAQHGNVVIPAGYFFGFIRELFNEQRQNIVGMLKGIDISFSEKDVDGVFGTLSALDLMETAISADYLVNLETISHLCLQMAAVYAHGMELPEFRYAHRGDSILR